MSVITAVARIAMRIPSSVLVLFASSISALLFLSCYVWEQKTPAKHETGLIEYTSTLTDLILHNGYDIRNPQLQQKCLIDLSVTIPEVSRSDRCCHEFKLKILQAYISPPGKCQCRALVYYRGWRIKRYYLKSSQVRKYWHEFSLPC